MNPFQEIYNYDNINHTWKKKGKAISSILYSLQSARKIFTNSFIFKVKYEFSTHFIVFLFSCSWYKYLYFLKYIYLISKTTIYFDKISIILEI